MASCQKFFFSGYFREKKKKLSETRLALLNMLLLRFSTISVLLVLNACFAASSGTRRNEGTKYYSSIFKTGLVRFIQDSRKILRSDGATKIAQIKQLDNSYYDINSAKNALHNDTLNMRLELGSVDSVTQAVYGNYVHFPGETKSVSIFQRMKIGYRDLELGAGSKLHIPRVKHLKRILPEITLEPYQRLMSFSIEVCMIPSIWYLELIHCMYMGMARYFTGIAMSYSLQDVVGSAIMSIGYKDESFSLLNCYHSVSLVADRKISGYYVDICSRVETCLNSKPFSDSQFSEFRPEFERRINRVYSALGNMNGEFTLIQFARYSLLYSLYYVKNKMKLQSYYPERNFLPVRMMLSSLGFYCIGGLTDHSPKSLKIVSKVTSLISKGILSSLEEFDIDCLYEVLPIFDSDHKTFNLLVDFFCREIFSFGFINESKTWANEASGFEVATRPSRVLIPSYQSVIPKMEEDSTLDSYSADWKIFVEAEEAGPSATVQEKKSRRKVFTSRKLRTTKKTDPRGVKNRFDDGGNCDIMPNTNKLTKRITYILSRSKKSSDFITSRVLGS